jgi:phosphopantothenoylcysteine synthetase/decarboxylase
LVLNEVSIDNPAFSAEDNQVYFITKDGARKLDRMEKSVLAAHIWDQVDRIRKVKVEIK